jgi:hypothetical protein
MLIFLIIFYHSILFKKFKISSDIVMIYFINKETLNIIYNFIYLNKIDDQT